MDTHQVIMALRKRFNDKRRYAIAEEVGLTTGYARRRLDMIVADCYNSNGYRLDGFELKVSTADLRRELADPDKHVAFFEVIDYYTLVCPPKVVEPVLDIIPKKWGILIVNDDGTTRYKRRPLALKDESPKDRRIPRGFFASFVRAIQEFKPSQQEMDAEYERGVKDGEENQRRRDGYDMRRVQKEKDKLDEYAKLLERFSIYGDNIDEIMDEFESFRKLNKTHLMWALNSSISSLEKMKKYLEGNCDEHEDRVLSEMRQSSETDQSRR